MHTFFCMNKKVLSCMVARESNWFVLYIIKSDSEENNLQKALSKIQKVQFINFPFN